MRKFEALLGRLLETLLAVCLLAIAGIVVTQVVLRYGFNASLTGANEAITILFAYTTTLGAAVVIGRGEHIFISVAIGTLPEQRRKVVDRISLLLVATLNAVMLLYSTGWIRITGGFLMPSTGLPRMVAQVSVPLGCGLALIFCLLRLVNPVPSGEYGWPPVDRARRSGSG